MHPADTSRLGEEGGGRQRQAGWRSDGHGGEVEGPGAREPGASTSERDSSPGVSVFCPGGARPPSVATIAFINDRREAYGIEPICKVLPIAPSTYHDHVAKRLDPSRLSDRAKRDEALKIEVRRVFEENFRVYGARKVWRQLRREGFTIARRTVERLMASLGLQGVIRGKPVRTTISDKSAACPLDHVNKAVPGVTAECASIRAVSPPWPSQLLNLVT